MFEDLLFPKNRNKSGNLLKINTFQHYLYKKNSMKSKATSSILIFLLLTHFVSANGDHSDSRNTASEENSISVNSDGVNPCISDLQYSILESRIKENSLALGRFSYLHPATENTITSLSWPLRPASNLTDCSYYFISAYVDQDTAAGAIRDFNCGNNTYDSHRGTDISIWPFNFYKMDNNLVEVIAAAPGTIIDKHDGEYDRNCAATSNPANYVLIQHADGSYALYWHMKNGSITSKAIGQSVSVGEYLGVVGSSGSSSGPHLHFEIWAGSTSATRLDPFSGSCNTLNASSWWAAQKPYKETAVIKASVHTTDAVFPACPATETSNQSTSFQVPFQGPGLSAGYAKFYAFFRNEVSGLPATLSILNPNGSTYLTWNYTSANDVKARAWSWSKVLPTNPGTYTFQAIYNGITCSSFFDITTSTGINHTGISSDLKIYSSIENRHTTFELKHNSIRQIEIFNILGAKVFSMEGSSSAMEINSELTGGVYFYRLMDANQLVYSGKLFIQ